MKRFGSSGIRGLVNIDVTPTLAQKVGAALASRLEGGIILVGRDTRLSGEMLEAAIVSGIVSCGVASGILGIVPTPVVAWLTRETEAEAGVSITASHNPPPYNGFKIFDSTSMAYNETQQKNLEEIMENMSFNFSSWSGIGNVEAVDASRLYVDAIAQELDITSEWKVVCDLFNGATSTTASEVFKELNVDALMINANPNGCFPAGNPEPDEKNLERVGWLVRNRGSDVGFGFDGDGDRMMAVDEEGVIHRPDRILAAYAKYVVEKRGGGVVVTHVGASMCIEEAVEQAGGTVERTKVGDAHVTEAMNKKGAIFGGEPIGAWIHPKALFCPDGILSALKLLEALEDKEKTLSQLVADIPDYPIFRTKIKCSDKVKKKAMALVESNNNSNFGEIVNVSTVDGVRFELEDGWMLIRPSGTEPMIRITAESYEKRRSMELLEAGRSLINHILEGYN